MVSTPWRSRRTMTSPRSCRRPKTTAYSRQSAPIASIGNAQSMDRNASSAYPITEKSESSTMAHTHIAARDTAKSVVTRYPLIGSRTTSCTRAGISGISGISDTKSESTHRSSLVPRSFLAPPLYADDGERNVQLSTGMRFFDGSGMFSPSIRCISHIMTIYTLKEIR